MDPIARWSILIICLNLIIVEFTSWFEVILVTVSSENIVVIIVIILLILLILRIFYGFRSELIRLRRDGLPLVEIILLSNPIAKLLSWRALVVTRLVPRAAINIFKSILERLFKFKLLLLLFREVLQVQVAVRTNIAIWLIILIVICSKSFGSFLPLSFLYLLKGIIKLPELNWLFLLLIILVLLSLLNFFVSIGFEKTTLCLKINFFFEFGNRFFRKLLSLFNL